jgi:hypothetical protein
MCSESIHSRDALGPRPRKHDPPARQDNEVVNQRKRVRPQLVQRRNNNARWAGECRVRCIKNKVRNYQNNKKTKQKKTNPTNTRRRPAHTAQGPA